MRKNGTRGLILVSCLALAALGVTSLFAADAPKSRENLEEPVFREARATAPSVTAHPLDPALTLARDGLTSIRTSVSDYTATMVKRERIDGKLLDYEYMFVKVRNRKDQDGKVVQPFSVYMYFLKPTDVKGREVIYIGGQNENKLIAHEGGAGGKFLPTVWLAPTGVLAMRNQRYPITEVGIENLVLKLIERGEMDKARGNKDCEVTFHENAKINGRTCKLLQIKNAQPSPQLDFHMAQIFIDNELNVPIRYAAYDFPTKAGEQPPVIEEYTYLNLKLNVGLTDKDFDHNNTEYAFH